MLDMRKEIHEKLMASDLTQVDLHSLEIGDNEIQEIVEEIINIRSEADNIYLNNNKIGNRGAMLLAQGLSPLLNLSFNDLQFNNIDKEGAEAIFTLKTTHPGLRIALHGNKISDALEMHKIEQKYE